MIKKVINKFFPSRKKDGIVELQALAMMHPILDRFTTPVIMTGSSLQPSALISIQNDIILNERKTILETGSGVGTLYLAMVAKTYQLDIDLYSIEEDLDWIEILKASLQAEDLIDYVHFIHAPIDTRTKWYQKDKIEEVLSINQVDIDCLIIDGPRAYKRGFENARSGAIDVLGEKLSERCFVLVDDTNRKRERSHVKAYEAKYGLGFSSWYGTFSIAIRGDSYNIKPI